jgi:formylglycine-generating enzyme required for sulfatase activity
MSFQPASSAQHVFISYSSRDNEYVERLIADLQAQDVNIWIDHLSLKAGTRNWENAIRRAIRDCCAVVLVASPSSFQSEYVHGELAVAKDYGRPVYPLWVSGKQWIDCVPMDMSKVQYIDGRGDAYPAAIPQIIEALGGTGIAPVQKVQETAAPETASMMDFVPRNPYKGLRAFRADDQVDFFGRDGLIVELVAALKEQLHHNAARLLVIIGPSGSGKSSVVMAGLLPRLQHGILPGSQNWLYLSPIMPGTDPLENLMLALAEVLPERAHEAIRQDLGAASARGLHTLVRQIAGQTHDQLVLVVDQFEELFTHTTNDEQRRQFINLLVTAATEPGGPLVLILTLRADYADHPMSYLELGKLVHDHSHPVLPLSLTNLYDVIQKPAALNDVRLVLDEGLTAELAFEVRDLSGGLPLLQFTLDQLFEQREGLRLTWRAYRKIGGLRGALAKRAEETYQSLRSEERQRLARALFLRLVDPGETYHDAIRRRVSLTQLTLSDGAQSNKMREVADAFVADRLLTADQATIEVTHEALIREWPRLKEWLRKHRDDSRFQKGLSDDVSEWLRRGRPTDRLYRETQLREATEWADRNIPTRDEAEFIHTSQTEQDRLEALERERQARELRLLQKAANSARRAEEAERARATRFRRAAIVAGGLAALAMIVIAGALVAADDALDKMDTAQTKLTTAEFQVTLYVLEQQYKDSLMDGLGMFPTYAQTPAPPTIVARATEQAGFDWEPQPTMFDDNGVEMMQVPPGCFFMGSGYSAIEQPVEEFCTDEPFWIDRYEVSKEQFDRLGGKADQPSSSEDPDLPRTNISWFEARDFCEQRRGAHLPTEAQWEYAAKGPNNLLYPWGNDFDAQKVVWADNSGGQASHVSSHTEGRSWVGAHHMSGNVWEWTSTIYDPDTYAYPYATDDGREALNPTDVSRVMRGGGWNSSTEAHLRTAYREVARPDSASYIGFRCVRLP